MHCVRFATWGRILFAICESAWSRPSAIEWPERLAWFCDHRGVETITIVLLKFSQCTKQKIKLTGIRQCKLRLCLFQTDSWGACVQGARVILFAAKVGRAGAMFSENDYIRLVQTNHLSRETGNIIIGVVFPQRLTYHVSFSLAVHARRCGRLNWGDTLPAHWFLPSWWKKRQGAEQLKSFHSSECARP